MAFDLDRTSHHFRKCDDGGVRAVVSDDPTDRAQIALVRAHLTAEADQVPAW